eukprot:TRINITY_DN1594_c0_g2_i1.p1 TRINITY_DN1594_c0_g2~~TRINITY_DN1594_c0_g2_i1.p1  ORF type:complete len:432 (-),score=61.47 TRINITY_DN1594_c0_g2_i1:50-1345(-)
MKHIFKKNQLFSRTRSLSKKKISHIRKHVPPFQLVFNNYSSRTDITSKLWEKRFQFETDQLKNVEKKDVGSQAPSFLLEKTPQFSRIEITYPFSTDIVLRDQYLNFYGGLRFGKILEDLDACAGTVSHKHADDNNPVTRPLTIVTASVDRIDLLDKLYADRDLRMDGCLSYVGTSSMEVRIEVHSKDPISKNYEPLILASFTMVATYGGKSAPVNRLVPQTEQEKAMFKQGEANKNMRKQLKQSDLKIKPPTSEESAYIHSLFLEAKKSDVKTKDMATSCLQTVLLCHPQQKNTNNKIFGGYLMRKSYELAWANARTYCQDRTYFLSLDEVNFVKPVNLGDIVLLSSQVIYTEGHSLGVKVLAEVVKHGELGDTKYVTNTFHFTFTCPTSVVPRVFPNTYLEAITYLDGKRRYQIGLDIAKSLDSRLLRFY